MTNPVTFLLMFAAGGTGVLLRYCMQLYFSQSVLTTLYINLLGSSIFGLIAGLKIIPVDDTTKLLLTTGVLGGFTTFSAFSYELMNFSLSKNWVQLFAYGLGSPFLGWLFCILSFAVSRRFF